MVSTKRLPSKSMPSRMPPPTARPGLELRDCKTAVPFLKIFQLGSGSELAEGSRAIVLKLLKSGLDIKLFCWQLSSFLPCSSVVDDGKSVPGQRKKSDFFSLPPTLPLPNLLNLVPKEFPYYCVSTNNSPASERMKYKVVPLTARQTTTMVKKRRKMHRCRLSFFSDFRCELKVLF